MTELLAILIAIVFACFGYEDNRAGAQKKEDVIKTIKEKVESPEGIYVKEGMWRDALYLALPFGIDMIVKLLNSIGAFNKSS